MCMQCKTRARIVVHDVVPGYNLMKAMVDGDEWKKDQYALVAGNNPSIMFSALLPAPANDKEGDLSTYIEVAQDVDTQVGWLEPSELYILARACAKCGLPQGSKLAGDLALWLVDYCYSKLTPKRVPRSSTMTGFTMATRISTR